MDLMSSCKVIRIDKDRLGFEFDNNQGMYQYIYFYTRTVLPWYRKEAVFRSVNLYQYL